MNTNLSPNNDDKRTNLLLYISGKTATPSELERSVRGRIGNTLSGAIAYKREPSFFDEDEIKKRDKELKELLELKSSDTYLSIERRDKPVVLSSIQSRLLFALSCALDIEDEEIKKKIKNPFTPEGGTIKRPIDISALSNIIFGNSRFRERKKIIDELFKISKIRQVQIIGRGRKKFKITAPFINIGETIEDLDPENAKGLDFVNVMYGGAFFHELDKRFSIATTRLFEVWRLKPYGTEMFNILLNSLLSVYWYFKKASEEAEARVKKDLNKTKRISREDYAEEIRKAREEALSYQIDVASIKERLTRDYDSNKVYRNYFWRDLKIAVEGLKAIDLITGYDRIKGAKGQDKIIFHFSPSYNYSEKLPKLLSDKNSDKEEITPF